MHREIRQQSWSDEVVANKGRNEFLDELGRILDWDAIGRLVSVIYASPKGRPSYPPLLMVKALLLAQWHSLSDPQLEQALSDRLSFRRFAGLSLEEDTPDHSTVSRFREQLRKRSLDAALFEEVNRQLAEKGLFLKQGTILDATLLKAQAAKPNTKDPQQEGRSSVDRDANWTRNNLRQSFFGYKAHIAVDMISCLVRRAILTPAKTNESEVADTLICRDEKAVYADKAYEKRDRRLWLKSLGIKDRIMHRRISTQKELPYWQQRRNKLIKPIRQQIEHIFGTLKRTYHYREVRYTSLRANTTQLHLLLVAFNLRRAVALTT